MLLVVLIPIVIWIILLIIGIVLCVKVTKAKSKVMTLIGSFLALAFISLTIGVIQFVSWIAEKNRTPAKQA